MSQINYVEFKSVEELDQYVKRFDTVEDAMRSINKYREYYYRLKKKLPLIYVTEICNRNDFVNWVKANPDHIDHKYFMDRLVTNPRRGDLSTVGKVIEILKMVNKWDKQQYQ